MMIDDNTGSNHNHNNVHVVAGVKRALPVSSSRNNEKKIKTENTLTTSHKNNTGNKGNNNNKANKGLRHFSMMVCKKVEEKGKTTYNEVADELVKEFIAQRDEEQKEMQQQGEESTMKKENSDNQKKKKRSYDEKNIRRRVYDALNVLMAMGILTKEKKEIQWKGLPSHTHADLDLLHRELEYRQSSVEQKRYELQQTLHDFICKTNLTRRNHQISDFGPSPPDDNKLPLPFFVVNTNPETTIQCDMSSDASSVKLNINGHFTLSNNDQVLHNIGLSTMRLSELENMLPSDLFQYCQKRQMLHPLPSSSSSPTSSLRVTAYTPSKY